MRIVFTTPILEHPPAGGPQLRIDNSIKALSRVSEVYLFCRSSRDRIGGDEACMHYSNIVKELEFSRAQSNLASKGIRRKLQLLFRKLNRKFIKKDARLLAEYARRNNADCVWFGYGNISFPLISTFKKLCPDIKIICDTDSVWSRFVLRELPYQKNPLRKLIVYLNGKLKEKEERQWVELCDVTTAVSEFDADYYRSLSTDRSKVHVFSNVIDVAQYQERREKPTGFIKPCLYLAGTFGRYYSPMDVAARWVLDEIFPAVLEKRPDAHLYIVGRDSDKMLSHRQSNNVTVTGILPSVLPYLQNADIALVPLKFESGTRYKILEAAACGIPVVSTTLGAEGLPVQNGRDLLIADSAEEFTAAILDILNGKVDTNSMVENCKRIVNENFSVESLTIEAAEIIRYMEND